MFISKIIGDVHPLFSCCRALKKIKIFYQNTSFTEKFYLQIPNNETFDSESQASDAQENMYLAPATPSSSISSFDMTTPLPKRQCTLKPMTKNAELLSLACNYLHTSQQQKLQQQAAENKYPVIVQAWSEKLLSLHPQQRLYAEKAINDILFEATLGNLDRYSVKINENEGTANESSD